MRRSDGKRKAGAIRFLAASALFMVASGGAHAAGLDCSKAASTVDHIICGDKSLIGRDRLMSKLYAVARNKDDNGAVRAAQQQWLAKVQACGDAACVKEQYDDRIPNLITNSSGIATTSYSRSHSYSDGSNYSGTLQMFGPDGGLAVVSISGIYAARDAATNGNVYASGLDGVATMRGGLGHMDMGDGCIVTLRRFGSQAWRITVTKKCTQEQADYIELDGVYRR
ncbi:hypothetical protein QD460_31195 [Rhizobium jaguaris]|uniref:DUF1311 domain-containing protein n=1 Tax=Rhizobium jaguaris TaxID=1312183 RepID=A0A387G1W0_9HYPH|nr:hypothetical protein [Rhizobium jaguaris]AYG62171.1 hypothetical protein CCGE525_25385 [Rhizobium jaguaris]